MPRSIRPRMQRSLASFHETCCWKTGKRGGSDSRFAQQVSTHHSALSCRYRCSLSRDSDGREELVILLQPHNLTSYPVKAAKQIHPLAKVPLDQVEFDARGLRIKTDDDGKEGQGFSAAVERFAWVAQAAPPRAPHVAA